MRNVEPQISPIREEDLPALIALARDIWYHHYPSIITVEQIEYMFEQRYHPQVIATQLGSTAVWWEKMLLGSDMIAFTSYELGAHTAEMKLDKLYVHQRMQGRGFGSRLIRHVEQTARARGCTRLYLQVNKNNAGAIQAYLRNGFSVAESAIFDIGRGFVMDDYVMSKSLV